jgi:hypothetical protein
MNPVIMKIKRSNVKIEASVLFSFNLFLKKDKIGFPISVSIKAVNK